MPLWIGDRLNREWNVRVRHALYRKDGTWYHVLTHFPAAFFDKNGYVKFNNEQDYQKYIRTYANGINEVSLPQGISSHPGYIKVLK